MQCSRLPQAALNQMIEGAKILEADSYGAKVYLLQDGNILKLFRRKRLFSSALLRPYSRRFINNVLELEKRGVPTLKVLSFYQLEKPGMTAVLYRPLPGETLRQIAEKNGFDWTENLPRLVELIRHLHAKGIYFRSLHLGNILQTPDGGFGLIDFLDIRFKGRPLGPMLVRRNFEHLRRYLQRRNVENFPLDELLLAYAEASKASN